MEHRTRNLHWYSQGFTLIEVLVALAIVAIALLAGGKAMNALTQTAGRQSDVMLAQLCAENQLAAARLSQQLPGLGTSSVACEQAGRSFDVRVGRMALPLVPALPIRCAPTPAPLQHLYLCFLCLDYWHWVF